MAKKTYRSSSYSTEYTGTRAEAIEAATKMLQALADAGGIEIGNRFTWRADDESGFTIAIRSIGQLTNPKPIAMCASKWNAAKW